MAKLQTAIYTWKSLREASKRLRLDYSTAVKRFLYLYGKRQFSPTEIFFNDLLSPRIPTELLPNYLSREAQNAFGKKRILRSYVCLTTDKAIFYSLCFAAGVPIPKLLAVFDVPVGWTPDGRMLSSRADWRHFIQSLPSDFIVKPAHGMLGKGVAAFRREGAEFLDRDGPCLSSDELYELLCSRTEDNLLFGRSDSDRSVGGLEIDRASHKAIIQERVFAHPVVAELTGSDALCCCRFYTYTDDSVITHVLASSFRVIAGKNLTDNLSEGSAGNLWCTVDYESGQVVEAFAKATAGERLEVVGRHPSTGQDINGFTIPHWREAADLALRLAKIFYPQPLIHWDIGIAREGPIAIEGNIGGGILPTPLRRPADMLLENA